MADLGADKSSGGREEGVPRRSGSRLWYLLLTPPFIGLLWVPFYAHPKPELFGFPFFYWYQFAWVLVTAALTWIVHKRVR